MRFSQLLQSLAILCFSLPQAYASFCNQNAVMGTSITDTWDATCESINYLRYDPYGPETGYPAKFFQFEIDREADIRITMSESYNSKLFLISGNDKHTPPFLSTSDDTLETRLEAGVYIVEAANRYATNATFKVEYNDIGSNQCVSELSMGTTITDGWISDCKSTSRDIDDPYDTIPGEGHRAKFFTFTLLEDADIAIKVNASIDSYMYILEGHGEHGTPYAEIPQESSSQFLIAGEYTLELTTKDRYAPGQFSLQVSTFINSGGCSQSHTLGNTINGAWSADCSIRSWLDSNGDPYQGGNSPERANYYSFTLQQATDVKFVRTGNNSDKTVMSIYAAGDYLNKLKSTSPSYSWHSPVSEMSTSLPAGDYELEITQSQQVASGQYEIHSKILTTNGCNNLISTGESKAGITSPSCLSNNRGIEGNIDPYGSQKGTYYAKRFEFTLDSETVIRIAANTSEYSYLYLAKKVNGALYPLTQSWLANYWNTSKYPSIERKLDKGSYVIELTSHYAEKEMTFDLFLNSSQNTTCQSFVRLNERRSNENLYSNCRSQTKQPIYNNDPYSSNNGTRYFYAKEYSFEIIQEGDYDLTTLSNSLDTHIYLFDGGDSNYSELDDKSSFSNSNTLTVHLTPGIYSTEITTSTPQQTGKFSLVLWDKSSVINEHEGDTSTCTQALANPANQTINSTLEAHCKSESQGSNYNAKYYTFNTLGGSQASLNLLSEFYLRLNLSRWENGQWMQIASNSGYSGTADIIRGLSAGSYRIGVENTYSGYIGSFTLHTSILVDTDGDGFGDAIDAFPNDPTEWLDTDSDGFGNNIDMDDDNDQVPDIEDAFPLDAGEYKDSDNDRIGDNSDTNPFPYAGDIQFSESNYSVAEDSENIDITINRTDTYYNSEVFYFTRDLSANAIEDYSPTLGKLEFTESENKKTISIPIMNDTVYSGKRSFQVILVTRDAYSTSFSQGHTTKIDINDDEAPTSSISLEKAFIQTSESENNLILSIKRSGDLSLADTAYFRTIDGSATAFSDYLPRSGSIDFPENVEYAQLAIQLTSDESTEMAESFFVDILATEQSAILNGRTEIVIASELSEQDTIYYFPLEEINVDSKNQVIQISVLRNNSDTKASISFSAQGLANEYDFSSIVHFEVGEKGKLIDLPIINSNNSLYSQRSIQLKLLGSTNGQFVSDKVMNINIIDSTQLPYAGAFVTSSDSIQVKEGESANLVVGYLHDREFEKEVVLKTLSGTADNDEDFEPLESTLKLNSEKPSDSIQVVTINDEFIEDRESLYILMNDRSHPISKIVISDNADYQQSGIASFSSSQISGNENATLTLALQRLYGSSGKLSFDVKTRDGSALAGKHYRELSDIQEFEVNETLLNLNIDLLNLKDNQPLYFFIDITTKLEAGKSITETMRINIIQSSGSDKSDNSFLGLGSINAWLLLLLAMPILLSRVRLIKNP